MPQAIDRGRAAVPSGSRLISVSNPSRAEATSYYELWFSTGIDPFRYGPFPGNYGVQVDRYSGRAVRYWPDPGNGGASGGFWQNWTTGLHMGMVVGWIPRLGWLVFGLTPLLLAVTGTTTWLLRRRLRRRKSGRKGGGEDGGAALAT
jgi:uncharacterized iron-regulated membrane protein